MRATTAFTMAGAIVLGTFPLEYASAQTAVTELPEVAVTASRLGGGIVGTSTSVITAEDIQRLPGTSLPDILAREPGIQVTNPYGVVNGARSVVDMRGFGAAATSNTLILVNGRRINDLDIAGVDLASIPRDSIERIEITRGNSGAVLYGDGAVGGVINIVTKTANAVPAGASGKIEGVVGSYGYREGNAAASATKGPWSGSAYATAINSDGYRQNNAYRQLAGVANLRYGFDQGSFYLDVSADDQHVGLPGARRVEPSVGLDELRANRRGARTPFDWAEKQGVNATAGMTRMLFPGVELIVDGGVRHKKEQAAFHGSFTDVSSADPKSAVDTALTTVSFTPRVRIDGAWNGIPVKAAGGFDYYRAQYDSDRSLYLGSAPIHRYDLTQSTYAGYWQQTVSIRPDTQVSAGARVQATQIRARDAFDVTAPGAVPIFCDPIFGCSGDIAGVPLDKTEVNHAFHLGIEHEIGGGWTAFARGARSFRVPNVDERVGMVTSFSAVPTTFDLRTQKSYDAEIGLRLARGPFDAQWSIYDMELTDEIHFRYAPNFVSSNTNLDPTRRYGSELAAGWRMNEDVRFKGGLAYTRAVFREGIFAGNDVPLVSRWAANGGVTWNIWHKWLVFDAIVRYTGKRRMDNDQRNLQPYIPTATTVDLRLGGEIDKFYWSVAVQNLFDVEYFDYAIASPYPDGPGSKLDTYNAYPLPGRTFWLKAGMTF